MCQTIDGSPVELHEFRIGEVKYAIALCPSDSTFMVAWQCPQCKKNNGGEKRFESCVEAIGWAKVRVAMHHGEYHQR